VNTRLQVEHPVTELVTGLDLVELQLRVARGEPLPEAALSPSLSGHAVEARLYAEDVAAGFVPCSGTIHRFHVPALSGIRVDSGYEDGSMVSIHYDAMLGKVIAHADSRPNAVARLAAALAATQLHGPPTNRDLLVRVLRHPEFLAGRIDTGFLTRNDCTAPLADNATHRLHAVAAAIAAQAERRAGHTLPSGWRNVPTALERATYKEADVGYRIMRDDELIVELDDQPIGASLWSATASHVDITLAGIRRSVDVHRVGDTTFVDDAAGASVLHELDRFPRPDDVVAVGSLLAPLPGAVVRVLVKLGQRVVTGETLIVLEAMKMEHAVNSPTHGTVTELRVGAGDQVDPGQVLAVVDEDDGEDG
jgi:acetyl/propionyl-CoA carboxylase alpha subunit